MARAMKQKLSVLRQAPGRQDTAPRGFQDFLLSELAVLSLRLGQAYEEEVAALRAQAQQRPKESCLHGQHRPVKASSSGQERPGRVSSRAYWRSHTLEGAGIPANFVVEFDDIDDKEGWHSSATGSAVSRRTTSPSSGTAAQLDAELDAGVAAAGAPVPRRPESASPEADGARGPGLAGSSGLPSSDPAGEGAAAVAGAGVEADGVESGVIEVAGAGAQLAGIGNRAAERSAAAAEEAVAAGQASEEAAGAGGARAEAAGDAEESTEAAGAGAEAAVAGDKAAEDAAGAGGQAVEEARARAEAAGDAEESTEAAGAGAEVAVAGDKAAEEAGASAEEARAGGCVAEATGAPPKARFPGDGRAAEVGPRTPGDGPEGRTPCPARPCVAPATAGLPAASSSGGAAAVAPAAAPSGGGSTGGSGLLPEKQRRRHEELNAETHAEPHRRVEGHPHLESPKTARSTSQLVRAAQGSGACPLPARQQLALQPRMRPPCRVVLTCADDASDAGRELLCLLEGHSEIGCPANAAFFRALVSVEPSAALAAHFDAFVESCVHCDHSCHTKKWVRRMQQSTRHLAEAIADGAPRDLAVGHFVDRALQATLPSGTTVALCEATWQNVAEGSLELMHGLYPSLRVVHVVQDEGGEDGRPADGGLGPIAAEGHRRCCEWGRAHPEHYMQVCCAPDLGDAEQTLPAILHFLHLTDQSDSMIHLRRR